MPKHIVSVLQHSTISSRIYFIRGKRVLLDADLAELYGVLTKNLNKAIRRNLERFPDDFMFQLKPDEADSLRFQIGTSNIPDPAPITLLGRDGPVAGRKCLFAALRLATGGRGLRTRSGPWIVP